MGVVFGLFAGFYYWFDIFMGIKYIESIGKLHFWLTFIGVNLTFFPQHFLGLAGMPRRIPDYPDIYFAWNHISSLGSLITIVGLFVFINLLINALLGKLNNNFYQKKNYYFIDSLFPLSKNKIIILDFIYFNITRKYNIRKYNPIYIYQKYNFWYMLPNNDLLYIYIDRYIISVFFFKFITKNNWSLHFKLNDLFKKISKNNMKIFNPLQSLFYFNKIKNNIIITSLYFFLKGWFLLFIYFILIAKFNREFNKEFKKLYKLYLYNLIFFNFLGIKNNTDNFFYLFLKKINILQKIRIYIV